MGHPSPDRAPRAALADRAAPVVRRAVRWLPPLLRPTFEELLPRTRTERTRRDWVFDAIVIAITLTLGAIAHQDAKSIGPGLSGVRQVVDLVLLPTTAGALLWRRRWPLQVALLTGILACLAPSNGTATLFAAFAVGAYAPPTVAVSGIAYLVVIAPVSSWLSRATTDGSWVGNASIWILVLIGFGAWGMFTGTRRQLLATLHERARRAEAEQELRVAQAKQDERTRIAREMHDVLAHRMSLLSVHAGALEFRPDAPPEDVARAAGVIRQTAHEALEELRTVIGVLRVGDLADDPTVAGQPGAADSSNPAATAATEAPAAAQPEPPQPTLAAVPALVDDWRAAGARIDLELAADPAALPGTIGRTAYRIVQEGLTNASKHAPATRIDVRIAGTPGDRLTVTVINPLLAGDAAPSSIPGTGLGLVGLRERTELAGGTFAAAADPAARRFMLSVTLPWPP
jgi:signal transduction histidine kinase